MTDVKVKQMLKPTITAENKTYWAPFEDATNRVTTTTLNGEQVVRLTTGRTPELAQLYADYQNTADKLEWLYANKTTLEKYDVNFHALAEINNDA